MNADTTFKQFVEEKGLNLSLLDFGSQKYRNLIKVFNEAKLKLESEEEAQEREKERARLKLNKHDATGDLSKCRAEGPKRSAHLVASQP